MPWQEIQFGGLMNSVAECRVPQGRAWSMANVQVDNGILELGKRYALFGQRTAASSGDVGWGLGYGKYSGNELQVISLTGTVTGGTFTLRWRPTSAQSWQTTGPIAYNCTASGMLTVFMALSNVEPGDVRVMGGPLPDALRIQFQGQYANTDVDLIELVTNNLQGQSPDVRVVEDIKGGTAEEYLAVVQPQGSATANLYTVDVQTGSFTQIASGLHASDWYFAQYAQRLWAVNLQDGLNFKTIGGLWNNGVVGALPKGPGIPPTVVEYADLNTEVNNVIPLNTGVAYVASGFATPPVITPYSSGFIVTYTSPVTGSGSTAVSVTVTLPQTVDYAFRDPTYLSITAPIGTLIHPDFMIELINDDATPRTITPPLWEDGQPRDFDATVAHIYRRWFHFLDEGRRDRDNTRKVKITWLPLVNATPVSGSLYIEARHFSVFPNDDRAVSTNGFAFTAKQDTIKYACSYYRHADGAESELSEAKDTPSKVPADKFFGCWTRLSAMPSSELNAVDDRVFFYRWEKGAGKWRRLPNTASWDVTSTFGALNTSASGTPQMYDRWMEHELQDFPEYSPRSTFPGAGRGVYPDQIGVWKQCLVVGANKQAWISAVGQPTVFAPSPDDTEAPLPQEDDLTRGKTEYVSDDRSEDVFGVHGQDSLYLVTPLSIYSIIGDLPAESTPPRRLPESRGTLGRRSSCRLGGGVLSAAEDGLWRYSVGRGFSGEDNGALIAREETEECRQSYAQTLLGGQLAASGMVVVEYLDERWLFNGQRYMVQTRNRQWLEGTLTDSVKAAQSVRHLPLRFLDTTGRMHSIGAQYTTDAGSAVTWSYTTGILDGFRSRIRQLQVRGQGRPTVTIWSYDGLTPVQTQVLVKDREDQNYLHPVRLQPGLRYRFKFDGGPDDTVEFAALEIEQAPAGAGN